MNKSRFANEIETAAIAAGPPVGTTKALDKPSRYGLKGSRFFSEPFGLAATPAV